MRTLLVVLAIVTLSSLTGCPYDNNDPVPDAYFMIDANGNRVYYTYDAYGNIIYFN